jgi:hypothetical protein
MWFGFLLCAVAGGYACSLSAAWFMGDYKAAALIDGHVTMKLGTALSICAQSITTLFILCTKRGNEYAGPIMGMATLSIVAQVVAAMGMLSAGDPALIDTVAPGVPSFGTWLCVAILAYIDLVYCIFRDHWRERTTIVCYALIAISLLTLIGHRLEIPELYWRFTWSTGMAIPTALCVCSLAISHLIRTVRQ